MFEDVSVSQNFLVPLLLELIGSPKFSNVWVFVLLSITDVWSLLGFESAEQKPKYCQTWDFLSALIIIDINRLERVLEKRTLLLKTFCLSGPVDLVDPQRVRTSLDNSTMLHIVWGFEVRKLYKPDLVDNNNTGAAAASRSSTSSTMQTTPPS